MIQGTVNDDGVPIVVIGLAGQNWQATIDTGFNGDLELPESLRAVLSPRFLTRIRSLLAGGQYLEEDNYQVNFPFDGQTERAEATFAPGNDILIGTHFLRQYRLEIDFVARTVVLERLISAAA